MYFKVVILLTLVNLSCCQLDAFMQLSQNNPGNDPLKNKYRQTAAGLPLGGGPKKMMQRLSGNLELPNGYANIRGEIMDMKNKVIQRVLPSGGGTNYYSYDDQNGAPVFRRREVDTGRHFVAFPDQEYMLGDGHYIIMRKLLGVNIPGRTPQALYEVYKISFGDSVHGFIIPFDKDAYLAGIKGNPNSKDGEPPFGMGSPGALTGASAARSMRMQAPPNPGRYT